MIQCDWGHPLIGPNGERIRVPLWAYEKLHRLGLKKRYSIHLHPDVYEFIRPEYDALTEGLRHLLGVNLSGPAWCVCKCLECSSKESDIEHTRLSEEYRRQTVDAVITGVKRC